MFSNSGVDEMAFTSGFNDTQDMKKSSRRVMEDGKKHKNKKKYKEIIKNKDQEIRKLTESLQRAKDDISNLQTLKFEYDIKM